MSNIGNLGSAFLTPAFMRPLRADSQEVQTAFANTGMQSEAAKTADTAPGDLHQLSPAALRSLHTPEPTPDQTEQLAQQSGVTQTEDPNESGTTERKRAADRDEIAEGKTPDGFVKVAGKNGVEQVMTIEDNQHLDHMDNARSLSDRLLGDIPEASVNAAKAMVKNQNVKQTAKMKSDPAVDQAASQFERKIAPMLVGALGIREPGNDPRSQPLSAE